MKTKTGLFVIVLVAITMITMICAGCESKEKKQRIDSLFNVVRTDSLYTFEQQMEALDLLIKERSWQKKDLENLREIMKAINDNKKDADTLDVDTSEVVTRGAVSTEAYGGSFTKTRNRCTHSACHCSGFWGYKHLNGTFEGRCSNSDGNGHTCGHTANYHGLRNY